MSRTHLREMLSVTDPLQSWNWDIFIPNIPGSNDTTAITYRAVSSSIPETSLEQVSLEAHGVKLHYAGRRTWSGTWNLTLFETRQAGTRDALFKWQEFARSWENNSGNYKQDYSVTAELALYDDLPQVVRSIKMYGLFPTQIGETQLNQQAEIIQYQVTFSYDWTDG